MQNSSARTIWHTANWLTLGTVLRFGRSRVRQSSNEHAYVSKGSILSLADDILFRQLALRYQINNESTSTDPARYWAPVFILFQQTSDLLHELHQQILELAPVRFAIVIPDLDRQISAFRISDDHPENRIYGFSENSDRIIRDMSDIRAVLNTILSAQT